ncbi:MAG: hypothetical protein PHT84_01860 [Candidatus Pacebacteria bacterium]|nr:hypothetical protein [Candidatus Paceibacterota bacterium]
MFSTLIALAIIGQPSNIFTNNYNPRKLFNYYLVILLVSSTWFLATYSSFALASIHKRIYYDILLEQDLFSYYFARSGLHGNAHIFSYHLTALTMALIMINFFTSGKKLIISLILLTTSLLCVFLIGQRALTISIIAGMILVFLRRNALPAINIKMLLLFLFIVPIIIVMSDTFTKPISDVATWGLIQKITDETMQSELISRITLQWEVLKIIFEYPQGLTIAGIDYEYLIYNLNNSLFDAWGRVIAPHNGFLTPIVDYGWALMLLIIMVVYKIAKICKKLLFLKFEESRDLNYLNYIFCITLISLLLNALGHNATFTNYEPATLIFIFFTLRLYSDITQSQSSL